MIFEQLVDHDKKIHTYQTLLRALLNVAAKLKQCSLLATNCSFWIDGMQVKLNQVDLLEQQGSEERFLLRDRTAVYETDGKLVPPNEHAYCVNASYLFEVRRHPTEGRPEVICFAIWEGVVLAQLNAAVQEITKKHRATPSTVAKVESVATA